MKKHKGCPSWLELTDDRTEFVFVPERAAIVRQIFEMSAAGLGVYTIAKKLTLSNIPAFGTSGRWDQSTIHNMLRSRATIGEYQKKRKVNGRELPDGEPIPGYYPAVVDLELFQNVQNALLSNLAINRGRKGKNIANLFEGIVRCRYCDAAVRFHSNGNSKSLMCSSVLDKQGCYRYRWTYSDFEVSFLTLAERAGDPNLQALISNLNAAADSTKYERRVETLLHLRKVVTSLRVAMAGDEPRLIPESTFVVKDDPSRFFEVAFCNGSPIRSPPQFQLPFLDLGTRLNEQCLQDVLKLTERQVSLLASLARGRSLIQTAEHLDMALSTARWHLRVLFKKTNTHSQGALLSLLRSICPGATS